MPITSCQQYDDPTFFKFCEKDAFFAGRHDPILISFTAHRWIRSDTVTKMAVLESNNALGLASFPLSLPKKKVLPFKGMRWVLNGYGYEAKPDAKPDWMVIVGNSLSDTLPRQTAEVLYSPTMGIKYIKIYNSSEKNNGLATTWVKCGKHSIKFDDMRSGL